jgi:hypothetical protein
VLQHEGAHLLALNAQRLDRRRSGADEIRHGLVPFVRHPHGCQVASPQQLGERDRVESVGGDPVARLHRDQRGRDHDAGMAEVTDQPSEGAECDRRG